MTGPLAVVGATGLTGRLVAAHLVATGQRVRLVGRRREALDLLAAQLPGPTEVRVADVHDPHALRAALEGSAAVCSTAGPFRRLGPPVLDACLDLALPYVDTSAEQPWLREAQARGDERARRAGVAVLPAVACEFAPSGAAAWIAQERVGPLEALDVRYRLDGFRPSGGTLASAVGTLDAPWVGHADGWRTADRRSLRPRAADDPDEACVPFPGGDEILLPPEVPTLREVRTWLVLPRAQAWSYALFAGLGRRLGPALGRETLAGLERRLGAGTDPDARTRAASRFRVDVEAQGLRGRCTVRVEGHDVYRTSAALAGTAATWLAQGRARAAGVHTVGAVLEAADLLDVFGPTGPTPRGLTWAIHAA
ncbi:MAG: saccharopine dehydrogenase NADP-binding domain-containing protein [Alphaproteobacteria bacterium]|nr:saccharopine dehydrogenase NADP-binding domain-containing protein [Alphaproteobacteria bacterium]